MKHPVYFTSLTQILSVLPLSSSFYAKLYLNLTKSVNDLGYLSRCIE